MLYTYILYHFKTVGLCVKYIRQPSIYYISYHAVYDGAKYHSYVMSNHVFYEFIFSKGIKGHKWILADILEVNGQKTWATLHF